MILGILCCRKPVCLAYIPSWSRRGHCVSSQSSWVTFWKYFNKAKLFPHQNRCRQVSIFTQQQVYLLDNVCAFSNNFFGLLSDFECLGLVLFSWISLWWHREAYFIQTITFYLNCQVAVLKLVQVHISVFPLVFWMCAEPPVP